MQRKNSILITSYSDITNSTKRSGFAMLMAIFVIVIIGTLMGLMISMSTSSVKRTTNLYLKEQATLIAKSATEYALLKISGTDRTTGCITRIDSTYDPAGNGSPIFNIAIDIRYIGLSGGNAANECAASENIITNANVTAAESKGSVLMDVIVTSNEETLNIGETISYHRRTLQKL